MTQWLEQLDALAEQSFNVVAFDAYGCDRSPKPESWEAYSSEELFQDLRALVGRFGAQQGSGRNVLMAHSFGCIFSLRLAAEQPDLIHALVLLGAPVMVPAIVGALFRLPLCLLERMQPSLSADFKEKALTAATRESSSQGHKELIAVSDAVNACNPMYMCKAYYRQLAVPSAEEFARVKASVLLLHGEEDGLVEPSASLRLSGLLVGARSAKHQVVQRCSHQIMQERPEEVSGLARRFLAELRE